MSALLVLVKTGMVFGLLAVVLFVLKKTDGLGGRARGGLLEVRGSTRLGKGATLTAVRVDGRDLLLGVTDHTVTLLSSEPAAAEEEQPARRTAGLKLSLPLQRKAELDPGAVAAALAALRGEPLPPRATDGPVASPRTEARPAEEQPCADHAVA